jgi:iron complex outermembrane receptor protein
MSRKTRRNAFHKAAKATDASSSVSALAKAGLSGFTLGSMAVSRSLFAADAAADASTAPTSKANEPQELQEVVVTGIRASLQRAMDLKMQSVGVLDAVSAEDIGQFPDASIGEALSRIPGVTVNRGSINAGNGATTATPNPTGITVRGFGTQFNEVLVEGRPVASGNGQQFDFAALGAEFVGELDILKSPDFALSTGAVGATINIKSPNPFDKPGMQARGLISGTDNQMDGAVRPAFAALFSDTFFDDTFGVLVAGEYTDKRFTQHHFDDVGWKGAYLPCTSYAAGSIPSASGCTAASPSTQKSTVPAWYIQDQAMYLERTDSRRKDGRLAVQWRPADAVLITLDDNFSSDEEVTNRWQYSTWFGCFPNGCSNVQTDSNGTITNFTNSNAPTDFNSFANRTYITTNTPGLNVKWDVTDQLQGTLDVSQSTAHLNPNHTWTSLDVDTGYGPNTSLGTNSYTGGVAVTGDDKTLPYWTAYGPGTVAGTAGAQSPNVSGTSPFIIGSHVVPIQEQINTDKVNQAKIQATWHTNDTSVTGGVQFVQDVWDAQELDTFTNNEWQLWSGYGPSSNNYVYYCGPNNTKPCADQNNPPAGSTKVLHGVSLPSNLFTAYNFGSFIKGYNSGNLPPGVTLYNPYAVLNYLITQPINADYSPNSGYGPYTGGYPTPALSTGSVQHVDRKNYAPFLQGAHTFELGGDMSLKANVGMRYQKTLVHIAGLSSKLLSLGLQPGDVTAYAFNLSSAQPITATNSYGYFLPSVDLNLLINPQLKVRFDYSKTETPPNNQQVIPNTTFTGRVGALSATGNNPKLLPYLSQNFDLGAEWYYGRNDYVSLDGFFKHVTQFPVTSIQSLTVPGVVDTSPLSGNVGNPAVFAESTVVNGLAANVHGIEATWQQMLVGGFGYQVNGTYVHSNANFNPGAFVSNQFALPGIGNSANLIAFFENYGFHARIALQWQAEQLLILGQEQNGGAFGQEPVYLKANTNLDFSSSYDIGPHFSVFFEALNLTDNIYHTRGRYDNQTLNVVDYGRQFTFGVRAKL